MARKNSYQTLLFLDQDGVVQIDGHALLKRFSDQRNASLMDYDEPVSSFTGRVQARVLGDVELRRAIDAYEEFREVVEYPSDYKDLLASSLKRGQSPHDSALTLELR